MNTGKDRVTGQLQHYAGKQLQTGQGYYVILHQRNREGNTSALSSATTSDFRSHIGFPW